MNGNFCVFNEITRVTKPEKGLVAADEFVAEIIAMQDTNSVDAPNVAVLGRAVFCEQIGCSGVYDVALRRLSGVCKNKGTATEDETTMGVSAEITDVTQSPIALAAQYASERMQAIQSNYDSSVK